MRWEFRMDKEQRGLREEGRGRDENIYLLKLKPYEDESNGDFYYPWRAKVCAG